MDETLLFPSPNWFLVSNFAVSRDGWIIYGAPSKSICVLEPRIPGEGVISGNYTYQAHVAPRAHPERVVSVDLSPEFPVNRNFISGGVDGTVKHWILEKVQDKYKLKTIHSHEAHCNDKEEVVGVGFSTETIAITVGSFGKIVKWDLHSNVCKTYVKCLTSFKPTCMSCSPHVPLNVAIGTKQGVIFVMDLEGNGKVIYKIRSQDDEITHLSWCPQFEVLLNKTLKVGEKKSLATSRMEAIRNEAEKENILEQSGIIKKLPEDSFDESVVEEDDMFDIYKDHEADEFGHKKYEPEDILVKVKEEKKEEDDYLAECLKLKEEILKRKNEEEESIESLVEALDKAHVDKPSSAVVDKPSSAVSSASSAGASDVKQQRNKSVESSVHVQKHLLASIGRYGALRIWSKAGRLMASCTQIAWNPKIPRNKVSSWPSVLWYKPDTLLLVDAKSQLLECNPLQIDSKNKLEWRVVHSLHKRGLFGIATDAPRVFPSASAADDAAAWSVFTVSQDRNIIRYSMSARKQLAVHNTCGGFLYNVQPCPYDAGKIAVSVGDGAIRVWQSTTVSTDEGRLSPGHVHTYWQNVQGKVLTVAWHPSRENLLAFGTAEARVGVVQAGGGGGGGGGAARVLFPALSGGVYSLSWADGERLFAAAGKHLVVYDLATDEPPTAVEVVVEGQQWAVGSAAWSARGLLCGSHDGAVAVLHPARYHVLAAAFVYSKLIHALEWHPVQTSGSSQASPYTNLIAVSSQDKNCKIIILEFKDKEEGGKQLCTWRALVGHRLPPLQLAWSPHRDELLLSTSQDTTVRVWDISTGACVSVFGGHSQHSLGAAWCAWPQLGTNIVSGGGDYCLRLWDYTQHQPDHYQRVKHETATKIRRAEKKKLRAKAEGEESGKEDVDEDEESEKEVRAVEESPVQVATNVEATRKPSSKFILPISQRQMYPCSYRAVKNMYDKFVEKESETEEDDAPHYELDCLKMFGSINEVNELLDAEAARLLAEGCAESWTTLALFRGQVDAALRRAAQADALSVYLLAHAPAVSFKYWKEVTQLYISQLDRAIARGAEEKPELSGYGGAVYRRATAQLALHDARGAVATLAAAKLFKEAYVLCRIRYMDSIAAEMLELWAADCFSSGHMRLAAICNIALGNLSQAATVLAKYRDQQTLSLAAKLAKVVGRHTFADHVEHKALTVVHKPKKEKLKALPSRAELLLKENKQKDSDIEIKDDENDENLESNDLNSVDELNVTSESKVDL